ncbi:MAG: NADPH-dependent FMN reductase [Hyphomicrobiales bacterium]
MNILALSGSLRRASTNRGLLRTAAEESPDGVNITVSEWADFPVYNGDDESENGIPGQVVALAEQIRAADGLLLSVPEYNFSLPGGFKNALDWLSRVENQPLAGKPIAIMGASAGPMGTGRMQYELRKVLGALNADLVLKPEVFVGFAMSKFDDDGKFTDDAGRKFIGQLVEALVKKVQD